MQGGRWPSAGRERRQTTGCGKVGTDGLASVDGGADASGKTVDAFRRLLGRESAEHFQ